MTKPETIFGHPLETSLRVIGSRLSWFWKLVVALLFAGIASGLRAEERLFTDTDGRTVTASVVRVDDENATLRVGSKNYDWPLEKLSAADRAFLKTWKTRYEATRAERLAKLIGRFGDHPLTHRAYPQPADYLKGDLFEDYLKRTTQEYRADSLAGLVYDIREQTAALFVPSNYAETEPFGVYVEVSSRERGQLPSREFAEVLEKHRMIAISPHGAGNDAVLSYRLGLALDALATVAAAYHIDPKRCYVGGVSGGGVVSTMICYLRPEHFRGAINIVRGALLEPYTIEESVTFFGGSRSYEKGQTYPPFLPHVKDRHGILSQRYRDKRWAFIAGEKDFNYEFTKASGAQWIKHGYAAKYFHVPGMGHSDAPPATMDEVFTWMER